MDQCLSSDQLERLLHDQLDAAESELAAVHIERCEACRVVLDRITGSSVPNGVDRAGPNGAASVRLLVDHLKAMGPLVDTDRSDDPLSSGPPQTRAGEPASFSRPRAIDSAVAGSGQFPVFDGFRIIREIGRGGMGVVYEAEEERLSRRIALKVLPSSLLMHAKQVQRFEREARVAAGLHHTNIVPVFGVGEQGGHHFYFMQYIDGRSLAAVLNELVRERSIGQSSGSTRSDLGSLNRSVRDAFRRVAQIGLQVAEALDHAHRQGVLHRDIKPSNLIQDDNGVVWVADFGLAKTQEGDELTSAGELLGTIRYMAPERFAGSCDERGDLYGLGVTLYELAARRPAYDAVDRYALINDTQQKDLVALGKRAPGIPRDLETIIHKATDREPRRRYQSAAALAEDLRRFLEDRPILSRQPSRPERVVRWCRRNRWASAFLLALGLGVIASGWQAIRATSAEHAARSAEGTARSERDRATRARDRALAAVRNLLVTEDGAGPSFLTEEMRATRKPLVDAGLRESRELVRELEGYPQAALQLVTAYQTLAQIEHEAGNQQKAIEWARAAVAAAQQLKNRDDSLQPTRSVANALQLLSVALPDSEESRRAASQSTGLLELTLSRWPGVNVDPATRMIVMNHINMGQRDSDWARFAEAIGHFQAARELIQQSIDPFAPDPPRQSLQGLVELAACRAYRQSQRIEASFQSGHRAESIFRALWANQPQQLLCGGNLAITYQELGLAYLDAGRPTEAVAAFEKGRQTLKALASAPGCQVSQSIQFKNQLAEMDYNMKVATDADPARFATARREAALEAYEIYDKLSFVQPLPLGVRRIFADGCFNKAVYQEYDGLPIDLALLRKSEQIWDEFNRAVPGGYKARGFLVIVRRKLAEVLESRGERQEAAHWRAIALTTARGDAILLFEIALEYARMLAPVDQGPLRLNASQHARLRTSLAENTMALLREAIDAGFHDVGRLRSESLLDPIRGQAAYRELVASPELPRDFFAPR